MFFSPFIRQQTSLFWTFWLKNCFFSTTFHFGRKMPDMRNYSFSLTFIYDWSFFSEFFYIQVSVVYLIFQYFRVLIIHKSFLIFPWRIGGLKKKRNCLNFCSQWNIIIIFFSMFFIADIKTIWEVFFQSPFNVTDI